MTSAYISRLRRTNVAHTALARTSCLLCSIRCTCGPLVPNFQMELVLRSANVHDQYRLAAAYANGAQSASSRARSALA